VRSVRTAAVGGIIASLAALLQACGPGQPPAPPPPEVPVIDLTPRTAPIVREWVGATFGAADVQVRARVTGVVEQMHFTEGSLVKEGALLYSIDANELDQRVAAARAELAEAETRLAKAEADLARYRPLAAMDAVSQRDLEEAVANEGAARGAVDAARAGLSVAQINRGYAEVRAPIAGYIGLSEARVGDLVGPASKSLLNTISRIDPIRVRFGISEREYLNFARQSGTPRTTELPQTPPLELILADGTVHPYPGRVLTIQRQVEATTGSLTIEAEFPNPTLLIRPGQFGRVRAEVEEREGAILVPQRAVRELQGQYQALVLAADDTVEVRGITVGPRIGSDWLVESGLKAGDRLVLAGTQRLRGGMKVVPKPAGAPPAGTPADGAAGP
jgi:membrane fusion protein (multidrug efflux system)